MILYIPFCHLVLSPWAHVSRHYVHFRSFLSLPREAHSSPDPQRSAWWALKPVPSWPPSWHAEPWFTLASPASSLVAPLGVLSCCSVTWSSKYLGPLGSWLLSSVLPRSVISPGPVVWPLTSPQLPSVYIQPGPALQGLLSSCLDISAWTLLTDTSDTTRPNSCPLAPTKTWPSVVLVTSVTAESLLPLASTSETSFFHAVLDPISKTFRKGPWTRPLLPPAAAGCQCPSLLLLVAVVSSLLFSCPPNC